MLSYLEKINQFIAQLDVETANALESISYTKSYKKGSILLHQGNICNKSCFIIDGMARKYYLNDGKEITTELYFKNDLTVSFDSYTLQQPSKEFIESLSDLSVSCINYTAFQQAKVDFPKLIALDLMLAEYYAMWLEHRLFQFHTMNATERYLEILNKSPHVVQHIPLTIIASYLGISLETLSRVRAKI